MSTYSDYPYVYAQLDDDIGGTCATQTSYVSKLKNIFNEAGWTVTDVPVRIKIVTDAAAAFDIQTLGISNYPFYSCTVGSGTVFLPDDSIDDLCPTWVADCSCVSNPLLNHRGQGYGTPSAGDGASRHQYILYGLKYCYEQNGVTTYHSTTTYDEGTATYTSYIYIPSYSCSLSLPTIGNQLQGAVSIEWGGFIAESASSVTSDNKIYLYITHTPSVTDPDFSIYYLQDSPGGFSLTADTTPIETQYFCSSNLHTHYAAIITGTHPNEYLDTLTSDDFFKVPLRTNDRYNYFVNAYGFFMDTKREDLSGASISANMFALKLKALEGEALESDSNYAEMLNIQQGVIAYYGVGLSLRDFSAPGASAYGLKFSGVGFSTVKATGSSSNTGFWGPAVLNSLGMTNNYLIYPNGVQWMSGAAEVAEPWLACAFLRRDEDFPALVVGQIWDACVPYRKLALGTTIPAPYFWDGEIWRYYQTQKNSFDVGPPSALSFRVHDLGIFDGDNYIGEERVTLLSLVVTPTSIPNGGSVQFDLTFTAPSSRGGFLVLHTPNDERCLFSSHIQTFAEGVTSLSVVVNTIDLGIEETATVKAVSLNTLSEEITFLAS